MKSGAMSSLTSPKRVSTRATTWGFLNSTGRWIMGSASLPISRLSSDLMASGLWSWCFSHRVFSRSAISGSTLVPTRKLSDSIGFRRSGGAGRRCPRTGGRATSREGSRPPRRAPRGPCVRARRWSCRCRPCRTCGPGTCRTGPRMRGRGRSPDSRKSSPPWDRLTGRIPSPRCGGGGAGSPDSGTRWRARCPGG